MIDKLIEQAWDAGVVFERRGEQVKLRYTKGRPAPRLVEELRARKREVCCYLDSLYEKSSGSDSD